MDRSLHCFTKDRLTEIFEATLDKTLGEVDVNNVFARTIEYPKITGIADDVIEQSVLGYPADSLQEPDLIVDGEEVELKTTGIRMSKKEIEKFEAKEPMSITAVSPKSIISEEFESSHFWGKLERLLLVYYLYDSNVTVPAAEYARFPIKGYDFYEFEESDKKKLRNDWSLVRSYIKELQQFENPADYYPSISSTLRPNLMLIDTAPKWPNAPRFRLKRATVTTMVQKYFGERFEELEEEFDTFEEIDHQLHEYTEKYQGKNVHELMLALDIPIELNSKDDVSKSVTEQIITRMFGAKSKKMSKIEVFSEIGLFAKTITQTNTGGRTEDTKMFPVDFEDWLEENQIFKEGNPRINKNGTVRTSVNFPKSKDHVVFFRGSGSDSRDKNLIINGISMYRQDVWFKGSALVEMLNQTKYI